MFGLEIAKTILSFGVAVGAGVSTKFLITAVTPEKIKPVTAIALKLSTVVIGAAVGQLASDYMEKQIDDVVEIGDNIKAIVKMKIAKTSTDD